MQLLSVSNILAEVEKVDLSSVEGPGVEIREGEHEVVGVLSDDMKKLYGYFMSLSQELSSLARDGLSDSFGALLELGFAGTSEFSEKMEKIKGDGKKVKKMRRTVDFIKILFWEELHEVLGLNDDDSHVVAEGWQVAKVIKKESGCDGCPDFDTCMAKEL